MKCPYLMAGEKCLEKCSKESIIYQAQCIKCEGELGDGDGDQPRTPAMIYFGETSRTLLWRSGQHFSDYRKAAKNPMRIGDHPDQGKCSSWILDHVNKVHGGPDGFNPEEDVRFTLRRQQRDPLSRQIEEATLIHWGLEKGAVYTAKNIPEKVFCLNRKEESFIPRERYWSNN